MSTVFFPSCKVKAQFPGSSARLADYIRGRFGVGPIGCCRVNCKVPQAGDEMITICHTCAAITEENSEARQRSVWEVIDEDPDFVFPDHSGETVTIQDCVLSYDRRAEQDAVRSLLKKMHFGVVELEENFDRTRFCGPLIKGPCPAQNAQLAPARFTKMLPHIFTPMTPDEQKAFYEAHCAQITTDTVVTYCRPCTAGIKMGGKRAVHMIELLFPES